MKARTNTPNLALVGERDAVEEELAMMVDEGLLEMGVHPSGDIVFWPTAKGCVVLGMSA